MKKTERLDSAEPLFYVALVLKGTEKEYLSLLDYLKERSQIEIIYQCKSLTYLFISKVDPRKCMDESPEFLVKTNLRKTLEADEE